MAGLRLGVHRQRPGTYLAYAHGRTRTIPRGGRTLARLYRVRAGDSSSISYSIVGQRQYTSSAACFIIQTKDHRPLFHHQLAVYLYYTYTIAALKKSH